MKYKTAELEGAELDAAIAKAEGIKVRWDQAHDLCVCYQGGDDTGLKEHRGLLYRPSRDWNDGGPIIERERIDIFWGTAGTSPTWFAKFQGSKRKYHDALGQTPLVAAMRAYVAGKLGPEVELP